MIKIKNIILKYKILLIGLIIFLFLICVTIVNASSSSNDIIEENEIVNESLSLDNEDKINNLDTVKVEIKGMVMFPGVYELYSDSRVIDVINKAGGLLEDANTDYINLSKKITDEMLIIIYSNSDIDKYKSDSNNAIYIKYECDCPDNINDACINDTDVVNTIDTLQEDSSLISINNANIDELITLPSIGEAKAKLIIEYREQNGKFEKLEELMNIKGIGENIYQKIKDYIKL